MLGVGGANRGGGGGGAAEGQGAGGSATNGGNRLWNAERLRANEA